MSSSCGPASEVPAPHWLSADEQRAWVAVAHLMVQLPSLLDAQLQRDSGLTLFEYLVLSRLSMDPDRTLRMSELAEMTGGSLSRLSNVVKRLEQRGYLERRADPTNRRFTNAILSETGWETVVRSAPGHVMTVRQLLLDPLGASEIDALAKIAERVRTHVGRGCMEAADRGDCDPCS